jgi:hypothetical protein
MIELEEVLPAIFKTFKGKNKIEIKLNPCVDVNIWRKSWDDKHEMYSYVGEFKNDAIIMKQLDKLSSFFNMDELKEYLQNISLCGFNLVDIDSYKSMSRDLKFLTACCISLIHDYCYNNDDVEEEISGYDDPQICLNIEVENFGENIEYSVEVEEAPSCENCGCVECECCGDCGCSPCECCSYCECVECECDKCDGCGCIESECECDEDKDEDEEDYEDEDEDDFDDEDEDEDEDEDDWDDEDDEDDFEDEDEDDEDEDEDEDEEEEGE